MRGIQGGLTVVVLVVAVCAALTGAAGAVGPHDTVNTTDDTTATPTPTDSTVDDTTDTTDSTIETVEDTTDSTVDDTTDTTDSTTETVDDTTDSTVDDTTDTTDSTIETVDETTSSTTDAVAETGGALTTGIEESVTTTTTLDGDDVFDDASLIDGGDTFDVSDGSADGDGVTADFDDGGTPAGGTAALAETTPELAAMQSAPTGRRLPGGPGPMAAGATAVAGLGALAAGTMVGSGSGVERQLSSQLARSLDRLVRIVAPFRYSRYDGSDPLEHDDRAAIHDYVSEHPGAYMSAISEEVGVNHSTARHHVKVLEREGLLENAKVRGRRRLFPAHAQQQELAAAMADEATADVLEAIARLGPCSGSALAEEVDKSVSTVSHHLSRLADDDLVVREKDGRATVNRLPSDVQEALSPDREPVEADAPAVSAD